MSFSCRVAVETRVKKKNIRVFPCLIVSQPVCHDTMTKHGRWEFLLLLCSISLEGLSFARLVSAPLHPVFLRLEHNFFARIGTATSISKLLPLPSSSRERERKNTEPPKIATQSRGFKKRDLQRRSALVPFRSWDLSRLKIKQKRGGWRSSGKIDIWKFKKS